MYVYSTSWGYYRYFCSVSKAIENEFGGRIKVIGNPEKPRRGAFDVSYKADDEKQLTLLFSKFDINRFPTGNEIVTAIKQFETDGTIPEIEPAVSWCSIM